jgi:plasmid stability protein
MNQAEFKLRLPEPSKAYLSARAASRGRSMNTELQMILRIMMQAEPVALHLTAKNGFHLIGSADDPAAFGAFLSRDEALTEANKMIASMPPGAAVLDDQTAKEIAQ